jgi:cobalt-zinc-cadmium efflux system outer membrane protein
LHEEDLKSGVLMKKINLVTAVIGLSLSSQALTLDEALQAAAEKSPELRAVRAEAQAASADIRAASAWSNPELEFEAEGLGGDYNGTDSAEYSVLLSQEFPTSGKIRKGRTVAAHAADGARAAVLETGRDVELAVRRSFIEVQAAQELLTVREQQLALAEEFLNTAQKRREAGAASELDVLRAELMLESGRGEKLTAEKMLATARQHLSRLTDVPTLGKIEGDFSQSLENPADWILSETHPALQRFQTLEKQAGAEVALAQSAARPDVTVGAGMRYEEDGNAQSYLFSASIPLPVFNRGRAEALAAGLRAESVRFANEAARRELETELGEVRAAFELASADVFRFRTILLPKAERAVELIQEGSVSGRYGWLEQADVQQALAENRIGLIEAQRAALRAYAQLLNFSRGE